jgi:hypothetical protein
MSVMLIVVITAADLRLAGSYEEQQLPAVNTAEQQLLIRAIQAVSGIVKKFLTGRRHGLGLLEK